MIWFGPAIRNRVAPSLRVPEGEESTRMERALRTVATYAPHLTGDALVEALAQTGWVDGAMARRLLPAFSRFDADRHFAESLRRLSFRGEAAGEVFQVAIHRAVSDLFGAAEAGRLGEEAAVRFRAGDREGVLLAYPEVSFTPGRGIRAALPQVMEEMPDTVVVVARNFRQGAAEQLASLLGREIPATLLSLNLLLGVRAITLRYQPSPERVMDLLGSGGLLRSSDIAVLGNRSPAAV